VGGVSETQAKMLEQIAGEEEEKNEAMEIRTIKEETEYTSKVADNQEG